MINNSNATKKKVGQPAVKMGYKNGKHLLFKNDNPALGLGPGPEFESGSGLGHARISFVIYATD